MSATSRRGYVYDVFRNFFKRTLLLTAVTLITRVEGDLAYGAPGHVDGSFNPNANGTVYATAQQADGKIVIGGSFSALAGVARNRVARINADGTFDSTFNPNANGSVEGFWIQADGKIVIGGRFSKINGVARSGLARINADGSLEPSFDPNANDVVRCIVVQDDGKMVIAGEFTSVAGITRNRIARLNVDGSLDTSYDPNANYWVYSMALQRDGKIIVGGFFTSLSGSTRGRIGRLNRDGTLDTSFDPNTNGWVGSIALQDNGDILIGGGFSLVGGVARNRIARIGYDGLLDPSFNSNAGGEIFCIAVQTDGKIVIGGYFTTVGGLARNRIARLNPNGSIDTNFDPNANNSIESTTVQADGRIVIGGPFTMVDGIVRNRVSRLDNDLATQTLNVPNNGRVEWLRGGSSPETQLVTFDLSTNGGLSWTLLGTGNRISLGWEITALSLPVAGQIRARAFTDNSGSRGIVEAVSFYTFTSSPLNVSPDKATSFGSIQVGIVAEQIFTLTNGVNATVSGTASATTPFSIVSGASYTLAPGQSQSLAVRFTPGQIGTATATLQLASNVGSKAIPLVGVGLSPSTVDADGNGLPDAWERQYFGAAGVDPTGDPDGDGLSNADEVRYGTLPKDADSDDDGATDGEEIAAGTLPRDPASKPTASPPGAVPVIFIPGTFGTELYQGGFKASQLVWLNEGQLLVQRNDEHLSVLRPAEDGTNQNDIRVGFPLWSVLGGLRDVYFDFYDFLRRVDPAHLDVTYFEYDWRLDVRANADALAEFIETQRARTGSPRVDIIAHSMGGLVAKAYLSKHKSNEAKVRKVVFIATPHYGSGKGLEALLLGVNPLSVPVVLNKDRIAYIARNMPGAYQLMPGRTLNDARRALEEAEDVDGDGKTGELGYDAMFAFLQNQGNKWTRNFALQLPIEEALNPRASQWAAPHNGGNGWDAWTPTNPGLKAYLLYGKGIPTTGKIKVKRSFFGELRPEVEMNADGDGTVPFYSARGEELVESDKVQKFAFVQKGETVELSEPGTSVFTTVVVPGESAEHLGVLGNPKLRARVREILAPSPVPSLTMRHAQAAVAAEPELPPPHWIEITLESETASLHARDALDNHTGSTDESAASEQAIETSQFTATEGRQSIIVPQGGTYRLEVRAQDSGGGRLIITETAGVEPARRLIYEGLTWTATGKATVEFTTLTSAPVLQVDEDGDGTPERVISADSPPVANAGPDQKAGEGATVLLDGQMSFAPTSGPLTLAWRQVGGPAVVLSDATAAQPSFVAPEVEADTGLTFALTVTAAGRTSEADQVSVTVKNITDLSLTQSVSAETTVLGRAVTYSFRVENAGTRVAHGVALRTDLPEGLRYLSASATRGTFAEQAGVITYDLGTLFPSENAVLTLTVEPTATGEIVNAPVLLLNEEDENQFNEAAPVALTVNMPQRGSVAFAQASFAANEADGAASITLMRTGGSDLQGAVTLSTAPGSALAGSDFIGGSQVVSFADGETTRTVSVTLVNDLFVEGSKSFSLNLTNPTGGVAVGALADATVVISSEDVVASFATDKGSYFGLSQPLAFSNALSGKIAVVLGAKGTFTATVVLAGKSYPLRGAFDEEGRFSGPISKTNFRLNLQIDESQQRVRLAGTISQDGVAVADVVLNRHSTGFTAKNPVKFAGKHTVVLRADSAHPEATYPQGSGYGTVAVATTGQARLTGVLGDLTAISFGAQLSKEGLLPLYLALYGAKGSVSGWLTFDDNAENEIEGTLNWFRPAMKGTWYLLGFSGEIAVKGSRYVAPPVRLQMLALPSGQATLTISGGGVTTDPAEKLLAIDAKNKVKLVGDEKFTMTLAPTTGLFSGTFYDSNNKARTFKGAVLQKQNSGAGVFKGNGQSGKVQLQPKP